MLCRNPFTKGMHAFRCGQCMPCLIQRRRMWTHRIMLEAKEHSDNAFVTLTYSDEHLPKGGSLAPQDFKNWLKRFRKSIEPRRIRYYGVGEYGDETERPHYHVAIFGYPRCLYGLSRYDRERKDCCPVCDTVRDTWGRGHVYVGALETQSAQYVARYTTKKMTAPGDKRLKGRHPEFARMSTDGGIGLGAMHELASTFMTFNLEDSEADVPSALRHGNRLMPLGRYLRGKLRTMVGKDAKAPEGGFIDPEMQALWDSLADIKGPAKSQLYKGLLAQAGDQKVLNQETRAAIFKKRTKL